MFLSDGVAANKICPVFTHHEQAASMAALPTTNIPELGRSLLPRDAAPLTPYRLLDAWLDIPVLYISGQVKTETTHNSGLPLRRIRSSGSGHYSGRGSLTKFTVMVNEPETIRYFGESRLFGHSRPSGPVWLDVPLDVQERIDESSLSALTRGSCIGF